MPSSCSQYVILRTSGRPPSTPAPASSPRFAVGVPRKLTRKWLRSLWRVIPSSGAARKPRRRVFPEELASPKALRRLVDLLPRCVGCQAAPQARSSLGTWRQIDLKGLDSGIWRKPRRSLLPRLEAMLSSTDRP